MTNINAGETGTSFNNKLNESLNHVINLFGRSNLIMGSAVLRKKYITRKHKRRQGVAGEWCDSSYFVDKTQSTQNKHHVMFFSKLVLKACQQLRCRSRGVCLTQWDFKLEPRRMQQFKGTQMTSAVLGNRE